MKSSALSPLLSFSDVRDRVLRGEIPALLLAYHQAREANPAHEELAAWHGFLRRIAYRLREQPEGTLLSLALAEPPGSPVARSASRWLAEDHPRGAWLRQVAPLPRPESPCLATLPCEASDITGVAVHPDGRRLASCERRGPLRIWDLVTGEVLLTLAGHGRRDAQAVDFSPDGKLLASGADDHTIRLWEVKSGACLQTINAHRNEVRRVRFHPDGERLISASHSDDGNLKLWSVKTGKPLLSLKGHTKWVWDFALFPDGERLATAAWDGTVRIWELKTGACTRTFEVGDYVSGVAVSRDGALVFGARDDGEIYLWDVATGERLGVLPALKHTRIQSLIAHPDGERLLAAGDGISIWDIKSRRRLRVLRGHVHEVNAIALLPGGRELASGSYDGDVKLWDLARETPEEGPPGIATELDAHPARPFLVAHIHLSDDVPRVYSAETGAELCRLPGARYPIAFLPGAAEVLTATEKGLDIKRWDLQTGACLATYPKRLRQREHRSDLGLLHPDGRRVLRPVPFKDGAEDVEFWDLESGKTLRTLRGHPGKILDILPLPGEERLLTLGQEGSARLWGLGSGEALVAVPDFAGHAARSTQLLPNRLAVSITGKTFTLWELDTGKVVRQINARGEARDIAVQPDGRHLVSIGKDSLRIWDLSTGKALSTLKSEVKQLYQVRLSSDGRLAFVRGGHFHWMVWDLNTGACVLTRNEQSNHISAVFGPGVTRWASIGFGSGLDLWELATGQRLASWTPDAGNGAVTMLPDGKVALRSPTGLFLLQLEGPRNPGD